MRPMESVSANPLIELVVKKNRMAQVMSVEILPSKIDDHARRNPSSIADDSIFPCRSSSLSRSKIRTFASTAMPIERMKPAIPDSVNVTLPILNIASTVNP